jgi:hypothetical protein
MKWDDESDTKNWECCGYKCHITRMEWIGTLNGYVGITEAHPLYHKNYDEIDRILNVHGGVTFCGVPRTAPDRNLWYIGFDTAHLGDFLPKQHNFPDNIYRDMEYVTEETELLARQIKELETEDCA